MEILSLLPLFPSVIPDTADDQMIWSLADDRIMFDMPTPPVSPSHADQQSETSKTSSVASSPDLLHSSSSDDDELDLGLGDLLSNIELPEEDLFSSNDWFTDDNLLSTLSESSPIDILNVDTKCEVSELRHDCMWAGHCPAEEHRYGCKRELPSILSSSPSETVLSVSSVPPVVKRTRLDTLGSIRPETPLSPSDSEMDALTSDECGTKSETSSSEDSESDEEQPTRLNQYSLPPNIHPVRNPRKMSSKMMNRAPILPTMTSIIPDHSYSHSDHSYHTQRRPASSSSTENGADCLLTPSDSEEEIDVVSLGELCRITPSASKTATTGVSASGAATPVAQIVNTNGGPIRLKLKVPSTGTASVSPSNGQMVVRKAFPSHPSAAVRQQLQLQLATAAQQRKLPEQASTIGSTATATVKKAVVSSSEPTPTKRSHASGKRPRNADAGSPRKRCSRTASDSEDSCEKRSQHNSMERQRRVDLRNAFEFLRSLIPDLESTDRAAKVVILKKAANFCQGLTQREKGYLAEKETLQKRQELLKKRLALLQRRR